MNMWVLARDVRNHLDEALPGEQPLKVKVVLQNHNCVIIQPIRRPIHSHEMIALPQDKVHSSPSAALRSAMMRKLAGTW